MGSPIAKALIVLSGFSVLAPATAAPAAADGGTPAPDRLSRALGIAYILIPVGIFFWIAFSLPPLMINYGYILSVLSDPLGLGWDILGTADYPFKPFLPEWIPAIQGVILLAGLHLGLTRGFLALRDRLPDRHARARAMVLPSLLAFLLTQAMLKLYLG